MKTALSIPDKIFHKAEYLAQKEGMSRSQFYVIAIKTYIAQKQNVSITEQLNNVYLDNPVFDETIEEAALTDLAENLPPESW